MKEKFEQLKGKISAIWTVMRSSNFGVVGIGKRTGLVMTGYMEDRHIRIMLDAAEDIVIDIERDLGE